MITSNSKTFYYLQIKEQLSAGIMDLICPAVSTDIAAISVLSNLRESDIESIHLMDACIANIQKIHGGPLEQKAEYSPLYFSTSTEVIRSALETSDTNRVDFLALDNNPFTVKTQALAFADVELMNGAVRYQEYELPSYEKIVNSSGVLN